MGKDLKHALAEAILEVFRSRDAWGRICLLVAYGRTAESLGSKRVSEKPALALADQLGCGVGALPPGRADWRSPFADIVGWSSTGSLEVAPGFASHLAAIRQRAEAAFRVVRDLAGRKEPAPPTLEGSMEAAALLFDQGLFFEVHELLEPLWVEAADPQSRRTLQGTIQVAVGFHHLQEGNAEGGLNQLRKGFEKLAPSAPVFAGLDVAALAAIAARWIATLEAGATAEKAMARLGPFPRMPLSRTPSPPARAR